MAIMCAKRQRRCAVLLQIREERPSWSGPGLRPYMYTYVGEDGWEYEAFEAMPCRRCVEEASS
jgi:hypothetical protein